MAEEPLLRVYCATSFSSKHRLAVVAFRMYYSSEVILYKTGVLPLEGCSEAEHFAILRAYRYLQENHPRTPALIHSNNTIAIEMFRNTHGKDPYVKIICCPRSRKATDNLPGTMGCRRVNNVANRALRWILREDPPQGYLPPYEAQRIIWVPTVFDSDQK